MDLDARRIAHHAAHGRHHPGPSLRASAGLGPHAGHRRQTSISGSSKIARRRRARNTRTRRVGSMGIPARFSFFPSKNLTVLGDGGCITTNNARWPTACGCSATTGARASTTTNSPAYNVRFNEINAAIGRVMLKHLDAFNEQPPQHRRALHRTAQGHCADAAGARMGQAGLSHVRGPRAKDATTCKNFSRKTASKPASTIRSRTICSRRSPGCSLMFRNCRARNKR